MAIFCHTFCSQVNVPAAVVRIELTMQGQVESFGKVEQAGMRAQVRVLVSTVCTVSTRIMHFSARAGENVTLHASSSERLDLSPADDANEISCGRFEHTPAALTPPGDSPVRSYAPLVIATSPHASSRLKSPERASP